MRTDHERRSGTSEYPTDWHPPGLDLNPDNLLVDSTLQALEFVLKMLESRAHRRRFGVVAALARFSGGQMRFEVWILFSHGAKHVSESAQSMQLERRVTERLEQ